MTTRHSESWFVFRAPLQLKAWSTINLASSSLRLIVVTTWWMPLLTRMMVLAISPNILVVRHHDEGKAQLSLQFPDLAPCFFIKGTRRLIKKRISGFWPGPSNGDSAVPRPTIHSDTCQLIAQAPNPRWSAKNHDCLRSAPIFTFLSNR